MSGKLKISLGILSAGMVICGLIALGMPESESMDRTAQKAVQEIGSNTVKTKSYQNVKTASASGMVQSSSEKVTVNTAEELAALQQMKLVTQNETLMLYVNEETAVIAVKDKRDGYIWFSNPVDRDQDPIASPLYKSEMSAQLLVAYYNGKGQINTFNSFDDSVNKKQFKITNVDQGVKIIYQLGKISKSFANIPQKISKQRFDDMILSKLPDQDARDSMTYKFKLDEQTQIYEVRKLKDFVAEEISAKLTEIGYTNEEAAKDNAENGVTEAAEDDGPQFTIPLEYVLDGNELVARVPSQEIQYAKSYPIATLQVLKYFGAAHEKKQGYMFVPDGSGALIYLNNNKKNTEPYDMPVYGPDGTFDVKERIQTNEVTRMPVFGMKQNDHAMIGVIEAGDGLSSITADISGRNDSYNTIASKFNLVSMDFYTLTSGTKSSSVPMFQTKPYAGDYTVRYGFLSGSKANYSGMAGVYRDYLVKKYDMKKLEAKAEAPLVLEVEGAFQKQKSFLGVPYQSTESLTTFDEARELLSTLKEKGVQQVDMRYVGWFNGGIRHTSPTSVKAVGALGGNGDFRKLVDYAKQENIGLYPDVAFQAKYKGSSDAATFLDGQKASIYQYDPVMYVKDTLKFSHYLLSPAVLGETVDRFASKYATYDVPGVSLRDLGNELHSDFAKDQSVNRQEALQIAEEQVAKLKQQTKNVMVDGGNVYTLPSANVIVNAPIRSSQLNITDEDIPFYQMALHGYVDLAGAPMNAQHATDPRIPLLRAMETGSNLFYQWYAADASVIKDSDYNGLYGLHYQDWMDQAVANYQEVKSQLGAVRHQTITGHRKLAEGVVETTFEQGTRVIINYNNTPIQAEGHSIDGLGYWVGGE
ncbi:DUF5696 domain-containing protein [Paenibacillus guangzhouensis]|uniref:DUF5696 domain-containing protein n=1 Tax=Paenibacillus guangzhouensis TaxID=1473112 RepID=UPI001266B30D|nr:DUF5696 domain-containing protein [Paenibacillus guangzhouensis]